MTNIKDSTLEELQNRELQETKAPVPTLRECFEILKTRPAPFTINVEIKEPNPDSCHAILDLADEMGILDQIFISSFHHFHHLACETYEPKINFGFITHFAQHLNLQNMLSREITPGDTFVLNFDNILWELNTIAPIISQLKDKGYKWGFWFNCGTPLELPETVLKVISGDWTGFSKIDASKLEGFDYTVDTVMTNWPSTICPKAKEMLRAA